MTIFSEVSVFLWWPGKTEAGQKWVYADVSVFRSSCFGFGMTLSCFQGGVVSVQKFEELQFEHDCKKCGYVDP